MTTHKPTAAVPTILGREVMTVTPGERRCTVDFGALEAGYAYLPNLDGSAHPPFNWWIKVRAHEHRGAPIDGSARTEPGAIEAIERALLAMRGAIPGRQREPAAAVDLEALKRVAEASARSWRGVSTGELWLTRELLGYALDDEIEDIEFVLAVSPTVVLALIAELEQLRAEPLLPAERHRLINEAVEQRRRAENARGECAQLRSELAEARAIGGQSRITKVEAATLKDAMRYPDNGALYCRWCSAGPREGHESRCWYAEQVRRVDAAKRLADELSARAATGEPKETT